MKQSSNYKWKLGMFTIVGLLLFIIAIYYIGKNKNMFGDTFALNTKFKNVGGLKVGNNVRFSGINIGTVDRIEFLSDSAVSVHLIIKEEVQKYIKIDAVASIGSDGLMGDKVLAISPGSSSNEIIKDNATIASIKAVEMEDLMKGLQKSVDNAGIITSQLAIFTNKMNNNNGALSKLMTDATFANSLTKTLTNLESSTQEFSVFTQKMNSSKGVLSKLVSDEKLGKTIDSTIIGLNETVKAAQNNFLLKGYFNKKKKAATKKKEESEKIEDNKNEK
jgi:phospholipid/cholesterol/gamma-HCH transport system substrate-binding protein